MYKRQLITSFGSRGSNNGQFFGPSSLAIDSKNHVYVADRTRNKIEVFDNNGIHQNTIGEFGSGEGQLSTPNGITIDNDDNLFVTDDGNLRVQKLDTTGAFITEWAVTGTDGSFFESLGAITHDNDGNIFVLDGLVVKKYTNNGDLLTSWGTTGAGTGQFSSFLGGIVVDFSGNVYISDSFAFEIEIFTNDGTYINTYVGTQGTGDGQFDVQRGLVISPNGLLVADHLNGRIVELNGVISGVVENLNAAKLIQQNVVSTDLTLHATSTGSISIINTTGTLKLKEEVSAKDQEIIDVSSLDNGQYILYFSNENSLITERFIVVK